MIEISPRPMLLVMPMVLKINSTPKGYIENVYSNADIID